MNLYTYKVLYLGRHQDLLAAADKARIAKLAQQNQAEPNQNFPKRINDVLQKVGQKFIGIYHQLYQRGKRLTLEKTNC